MTTQSVSPDRYLLHFQDALAVDKHELIRELTRHGFMEDDVYSFLPSEERKLAVDIDIRGLLFLALMRLRSDDVRMIYAKHKTDIESHAKCFLGVQNKDNA